MKSKKTIIISTFALVLIVIVSIIVLNKNSKKVIKSGDKVQDILTYGDYKTYFNYGSNLYDKNLNCYEYDYSKKIDCDREIKFWDSILIDIKGKNSDIEFKAYAKLDKNNKIDAIVIDIEKKFSERSYYRYTISNDGKEEYFSSQDDDWNVCDIIIKTKELNEENSEKCSKSVQNSIGEFKKEVAKELNKLDLTTEDLFSYLEWYTNKYVIPQYVNSKDKMNNKLSYDEILDLIQEKYEISLDEDNVVQIAYHTMDYYAYDIFSLSIEDEKVESIFYQDSLYKKYALFYDTDSEKLYGGDYGIDGNKKCLLELVETGKDYLYDHKILDNYYCSEEDKKQIDYLEISYELNMTNTLKLTKDELVLFAEEYYKKNK